MIPFLWFPKINPQGISRACGLENRKQMGYGEVYFPLPVLEICLPFYILDWDYPSSS